MNRSTFTQDLRKPSGYDIANSSVVVSRKGNRKIIVDRNWGGNRSDKYLVYVHDGSHTETLKVGSIKAVFAIRDGYEKQWHEEGIARYEAKRKEQERFINMVRYFEQRVQARLLGINE